MTISRRTFLTGALSTPSLLSAPTVWSSQRTTGRICIRHPDYFQNFDPADFNWNDEVITRNILAPLVRLKRDSNASTGWSVVPHLADSWTWQNNKELTIKIRDQNWANSSSDITAEDARYSFSRIAGLLTPNINAQHHWAWQKLSQVDITDQSTFTIELSSSYPDLLTGVLARGPGCVISRSVVERMRQKRFTLDPGHNSGRFRITGLDAYRYLDMDAESDWQGVAPEMQSVRFVVIRSQAEADKRFESGEIDHIQAPPDVLKFNVDQYNRLRDNENSLNYVETPISSVRYFAVNQNNEQLQKPEIRQAILRAINQNSIISAGYGELGATEATSFIPKNQFGALENQPAQNDMAEARSLVRQSFYDGSTFRIGIREESQIDVDIAQSFANSLNNIGLNTTIEKLRPNTPLTDQPEIDFVPRRYVSNALNSIEGLQAFKSTSPSNRFLTFGINIAEYDSLVDQAAITDDTEKRRSIMEMAQNLLVSDGWILPIAEEKMISLTRGAMPAYLPDGRIGDLGDWEPTD